MLTQRNSRSGQESGDLVGGELVLAVCGGIAAYKLCGVVSALVQRGCGVTVAMTEAAGRFVGPTTFQALSGRRVFTSLWDADGYYDPHHLSPTRQADLMLVAPATANIIGKIAGGIADELVSAMIMGADCPLLLAPAMNHRMWANPIVCDNIEKLKRLGYVLIEPTEGWLACGEVGPGRLAEPETIISVVVEQLKKTAPRKNR